MTQKLLVDAMLGKIARKLRIFGLDTSYSNTIADDDILNEAENDGRIVITKDKQLHAKAIKNGLECILLDEGSEIEHLIKIRNHLGLKKFDIDMCLTRCPLCNLQLSKAQNDDLADIPQKTLHWVQEFWKCKRCNKIYWRGSHFIKLNHLLKSVNGK